MEIICIPDSEGVSYLVASANATLRDQSCGDRLKGQSVMPKQLAVLEMPKVIITSGRKLSKTESLGDRSSAKNVHGYFLVG